MLRYYMTPETRESVIAESNRLIAARAARSVARQQRRDCDRAARTPVGADRDGADLGDERRLWLG